jgi:hypothetical protein
MKVNKHCILFFILFMLCSITFPAYANWTWVSVSGSNLVNQPMVYGTQGVADPADPANIPSARRYSVSWIDSSDNLWLFGGQW